MEINYSSNHTGTVRIETKNLVLRKFKLSDIHLSFRNWTNDERVTEFLNWKPHNNILETERIIKEWVNSYMNKEFYQWAITLKYCNEEPVGSITVFNINKNVNSAEVGYCLGYKYWGRGITTEALIAIRDYMFNTVKINRLEAKHNVNNIKSGKVMIKAGLLEEGTHKQNFIDNNGLVDTKSYALTYSDYIELVRGKNCG